VSALVELQYRIQSTTALISEHERAVASIGNPPRSLLANIRALGKLKTRLEAEYIEVADQLELEVYRYRLLNESDRVTLTGVAESWTKFQEFFASIYSALTKAQKTKGKKPPNSQTIDLGYGYSFASSIGVVVTIPRDIGIYSASPIEQASNTVFDLIESKRIDAIAKDLGPAPIQALHRWIDVHVRNQYGLGLDWRSQGSTKRSVEVQYQSLLTLQGTIADASTTVGMDVRGELYAVNTETMEFRLRGDDGKDYHGHFGNAITPEHAASVPARYAARIVRTTKIIVFGQESETTDFLDRLDPL
jgi:hypothetical protein